MNISIRATTGLHGLDTIIDGLRTGDNVVWQVDDIEDYACVAQSFVRCAVEEKRKIVYVRFAQHRPLIEQDPAVKVYSLDARGGFESFSTQVHGIISCEGEGAYYVFDCLSDLLWAWGTDLMIGNFFMIACPYLFQLNTIAYFGLVRSSHSFKTVARIRETTQILLDVYNIGNDFYVHPLKVKGRYGATMFLPHKREPDRFVPVTSSVDMTRLGSHMSSGETEHATRNLDYWDRLFLNAENLLHKQGIAAEERQIRDHLCTIMIGREKRILSLACEHFSLQDLLIIKERLIGTGYIGGKAAGMLIARKILTGDDSVDWNRHLEPHDSFFIGSDVFYTYIVENGWWKLLMRQKTQEGYFEAARVLRELMLGGSFPGEIEEKFWQVIEYFGQAPIIIRSSSLLEDAFGNAFAGKYESIFCINQGTPEERYRNFRDCVRRVFASMMNEDALTYRRQRGLDRHDEQMAILVQRVSGSYRGKYFFPDLAGVGISHNTFAWQHDMDPQAGMLRLVLGLGTRAVNRVENDYPRIVALDAPLLKPHAGLGDTRKYSQHYVDVLDVQQIKFDTVHLRDIMHEDLNINLDCVAIRDSETSTRLQERGIPDPGAWILTFDVLLSDSSFPTLMRNMLKKLENSYSYPVDIEFTVNFAHDGSFLVNLLQCRPLQTKGERDRVTLPGDICSDDILFQTAGNFMGGNIMQPVSRVVFIDPEGYSKIPLAEKYAVARLIGKINKRAANREEVPTLIIGPGRWGTSTPSLGIPVSFSEINNIAVLVELEHRSGSLTPELSFGTHFFQDLVETDIFYVALFARKDLSMFNRGWIDALENELAAELPESRRYENIVKVCTINRGTLYLLADIVSRKVLCYCTSHHS